VRRGADDPAGFSDRVALDRTLSFAAAGQTSGTSFVFRERPTGGFSVDAEPRALSSTPSLPLFAFDLELDLWVRGRTVGVELTGLSSDDTLALFQLSETAYLGSLLHAHEIGGNAMRLYAAGRCIARCRDGTEGQRCVTCAHNGVTVKICC
jgi:hypothetical protein